MISKNKLGKIGEQKALEYLFKAGYSYVANNWQRREGEIDLIVYDNKNLILVFVEVKMRNSNKYGVIEESISVNKKNKLKNTIDRYLVESKYEGEYRFDFIGIIDNNRVIHYKNVEL